MADSLVAPTEARTALVLTPTDVAHCIILDAQRTPMGEERPPRTIQAHDRAGELLGQIRVPRPNS